MHILVPYKAYNILNERYDILDVMEEKPKPKMNR